PAGQAQHRGRRAARSARIARRMVRRPDKSRGIRLRLRDPQAAARQAQVIMLDTHIAIALYEGRTSGLGIAARRAIDRETVTISPAVLLEIELLHEIGRLRVGATPVSMRLGEDLSIRAATERFADVAIEALSLGF